MAITQKTAENFEIDQGSDFSKTFTVTTDGCLQFNRFDTSSTNEKRL